MHLNLGSRTLDLTTPVVMGVLNLTPDSFSDGGQFQSADAATKAALHMVEAGASIIDIGGESTRPGASSISPQIQLDRVLPVIEAIRRESTTIISIDTSHPEVMQAAVIGVPDEKWGEAVKAIVVLREGQEISEADLIGFCREQLASYKRPRSVDFVADLPRNASGKVLKKELREKYRR